MRKIILEKSATQLFGRVGCGPPLGFGPLSTLTPLPGSSLLGAVLVLLALPGMSLLDVAKHYINPISDI